MKLNNNKSTFILVYVLYNSIYFSIDKLLCTNLSMCVTGKRTFDVFWTTSCLQLGEGLFYWSQQGICIC